MREANRRILFGILAASLALGTLILLAVRKAGETRWQNRYSGLVPATAPVTITPPAARKIDLSLIIPATYIDFLCFKHRFFTSLYANIIDPPKEIIFVVSSVPANISKIDFPKAPSTGKKFDSTIHIVLYHSGHNAAQNRNIGASLATGELLSFIDMDDRVHPQRFEVIRYLMLQKYPAVDAALFGYKMGSHDATEQYQFEKIDLESLDPPYDSEHLHIVYRQFLLENPERQVTNIIWCCEPIGVATVQNGWGTYRRETFLRYQFNESSIYNRGQDSELNTRLILGREKFTFWKVVLGFYEDPEGREQLCGEDPGSFY